MYKWTIKQLEAAVKVWEGSTDKDITKLLTEARIELKKRQANIRPQVLNKRAYNEHR